MPEGPIIVVVDRVTEVDCVVGVADCVEDCGCDEIEVAELADDKDDVEVALVLALPLVLMLVLVSALAPDTLLTSLFLLRVAPTPPPTAAPITIIPTIATTIQNMRPGNPQILSRGFDFSCACSVS